MYSYEASMELLESLWGTLVQWWFCIFVNNKYVSDIFSTVNCVKVSHDNGSQLNGKPL